MALTKATLIDLNSNELILDLDADTSITADTDDTIHFKIAGADELVMTGTAFTPAVADGSALGSTALEWSDLFLADGAVINFGADQDINITHVADTGLTTNADFTVGDDLFVSGGLIDLKNTGTVSTIKFYCESSNAHAQSLVSAPHSEAASNTLTLPGTGGNARLVSTTSTATLTNKTLTTPVIAEIDSGSTITLDATTDIVLDADGGDIFFKDAGTTFGSATNTSGNLIIKSGTTTAATFSGANVTLAGTVGSGNITSTGTVQGTTITATTAFVPDAADGAALGTTALEFSDLFLADASTIQFGADQDVTLTHVADTGLLLNAAMKIQFRDSAIHISSTADGDLAIAADDEIDITSTLIDINGNVEISGTATTTGVHTFTAVPVFPNNTIETADIQADAITAAKIADNAVVTAGINADAVTGAKIADDAINSEHYTDGSIDTAHIADNQVTLAKMAGGTDGNLITYDASGDPAYVATGSDGQVLTSTGAGSAPAFEALPSSGKILQVVSQVVTTKFATTSSSYTDTGITQAITPSASSSKVLVQMQGMFGSGEGGANNFFQVLRGSTQLGEDVSIMQDAVTQNFIRTIVFLDSPSTTSAVTYKVQVKAGSNEVFMNRDNSDNQLGFSTITLSEVGA